PVPYRSLLQEKIEPGQTLIVKGSTIDESQRFTINLHSKSADFSGNDVPLHISVRFDEGKRSIALFVEQTLSFVDAGAVVDGFEASNPINRFLKWLNSFHTNAS
ncbi:galactoside-binding lectin, partial [Teladorsagia circumcincta]